MADPSVNPQVQRLRDRICGDMATRPGFHDLDCQCDPCRKDREDLAALDALADALEVALRERDAMQKRLDFHFGHAVESWKQEVADLEAERDEARQALQRIIDTPTRADANRECDELRHIATRALAGVSACSEGAPRDDHTSGAIEMARHWLRNPGQMVDAGFEQVCRELYTVSRALVKVAGSEGAQP